MKVTLNFGTPPIFSAGIRFFIGGLVLWVVFWWKKETLSTHPRAISLYLQFAILNFGVSYTLTYWATQFIYSNLSAIIWAGFPIVVALLSHFMLKTERVTGRKIFSILVGTIGLILILANSGSLGGEKVTLGILVVTFAVLVAAYPNVYLKKHHDVVSPVALNTISQSVAGILLLSLSFFTESVSQVQWTIQNISAILYLAIFGSAIAWLIYFWLFAHISMMQISYVALFPPVIATIIGWIFLNEQLNMMMILGTILVLSGAFILNIKKVRSIPEDVTH